MKKLIVLSILAVSSYITYAQSCPPSCVPGCTPTCCKKSCRPESEATAINTMRNDLQTVITKMSKSPLAIDKQLKDMTIEKGTNDDESLLYISQAAASIRSELLSKLESSNLAASLKDYAPSASLTKQQMVANLKKEIELLTDQVEKL